MKIIKPNILTILLLILSFTFLFFPVNSIHSSDGAKYTYEKVNPDKEYLYKIKRLKEKIIVYKLKYFQNNFLEDYYADLAIKRFYELKYITDNSKANHFESSISRYNTFVGLLSEELDKNNRYSNSIKDRFVDIPYEIEILQKKFDPITAEWRFLQEARETTLVLISHF